ncbi:AMP-binding protein [Mycobacterium sp.]|uniref:AMP-binding protein n=1 Tax=Mycobacterium sp. TaxID=1785 RepID=UPI003BAE2FBC
MTEPHSGISYSALIVEALTRHSDRTAFIQDDCRVSYAEAADMTSRIRKVLQDKGIAKGDCVGALSVNSPDVWMAQAAICLSGAMYTGLHPLGSVDDHVQLCEDAETDILIVHPKFADVGAQIVARATTVKHLLTLGPADVGEDLLALCVGATPEPLTRGGAEEEDIAWLQYTGGTTGRPKAAMISQRAMVQAVFSLIASWRLPLDPRTLIATPITHAGVLPILPTLLRGGTVVLQAGFDAEQWLAAVEGHRINYVFTIPTVLYALLDHGGLDRFDLSSLETVVYGASPMSPSRIDEAQQAFGRILLQGYGQTECLAMATSLLPSEHDPANWASCGRAVAGSLVDVLDEDGLPLPDGTVGELCVRSRAVMSGYWKRPAETAEVLRDGWLRTGDMGYRSDTGVFHIVDRKKDMVISGGFNIYPREIEDVLADDPSVSMAAVIGVPDPKWGEAVKAFVVARPGATPDTAALMASVKQRKGPHHAPKSIEVVDQLPLTKVGKIDKKVLRAAYWAGLERAVN